VVKRSGVSVVDRGEPEAPCWEWHGQFGRLSLAPGNGGASSGDGRGLSRMTPASLASLLEEARQRVTRRS
jgi:hypothetical protein